MPTGSLKTTSQILNLKTLGDINNTAGQMIAEHAEGFELDPDNYEDDRIVIGGGKLAFDLLLGGVGGGKGGGSSTVGIGGDKLPNGTVRNDVDGPKWRNC